MVDIRNAYNILAGDPERKCLCGRCRILFKNAAIVMGINGH
jgi:hypothetical protein